MRDEACPMNLLRARRAVAALVPGTTLEVWLGEEGAATVPSGLASLGHAVVASAPRGAGIVLTVRRGPGLGSPGAGSGPVSPEADGDGWLRRFARQIVLPGVGEDGQRRWGETHATVAGTGDAADACAETLTRGGFASVRRVARDGDADVVVGTRGPVAVRFALARAGTGPLARARGALLADAAMRAAIDLPATTDVVVRDDGTVGGLAARA
ncbi:MAG: sulfurtransferase TusA family protein [Planctomycetota bacterium]